MKKCLIIVDMQNDFIDGALGTAEAKAIVPKVQAKIERAQKSGETLAYTMDTHDDDYLSSPEGRKLPVSHCIKGSRGWEIHPAIPVFGDHIFQKNGFGAKALVDFVGAESFDVVELVGLCTDICVVTNALMLKGSYPALEIIVDGSCCAGVTPESHQAALDTMQMCQIVVSSSP